MDNGSVSYTESVKTISDLNIHPAWSDTNHQWHLESDCITWLHKMLSLFNCKVVVCYTSYQITLRGLSNDGLARVAPCFMQAIDSKPDGSYSDHVAI